MVPLHAGCKFNNPLYVELMGKHFELNHTDTFLGKRVIMEHDYYDYIQDEQNRIWAFQMYASPFFGFCIVTDLQVEGRDSVLAAKQCAESL
jgi:hypothetical protein